MLVSLFIVWPTIFAIKNGLMGYLFLEETELGVYLDQILLHNDNMLECMIRSVGRIQLDGFNNVNYIFMISSIFII